MRAATAGANDVALANARRMIEEGRQTFRFDTFGDEAFWGDTLQLHQAIAGAANGGVGAGRQPEDGARGRAQGRRRRAAAPRSSTRSRTGKVNLDDPAIDAGAAQGRTPSSA